MKYLYLILLGLLLAGCAEEFDGAAPNATVDIAESRLEAFAPQAEMDRGRDSGDTAPQQDSLRSFLAYIYNYTFEMPARAVEPVMNAHLQQCLDAGPSRCQVLNSNTQAFSETRSSANLSVRAAPDWLGGFVSGAQADVEAAEGELRASSMNVTDLTRQILDTDARLKAQTALRDRLQTLLETRDGELKDLLEIERELARVQAEIESATSTLRALRQRVSMSVVNLGYTSEPVAVSRSAFAPIGAALKEFFYLFSSALGAIIGFFAVALPWLVLVILPGLWLVGWLWRRRPPRKGARRGFRRTRPAPEADVEVEPV